MHALRFALASFFSILAAPAAEIPLELDRQKSSLEYEVAATLGSFKAEIEDYELQLMADPAAPQLITRAQLRFLFGELRTGDEKRDRHMQDWQQTYKFPEVGYVVTGLETLNEASRRFMVRGRLTFHGSERDLDFPVTIKTDDGGRYVIEGEAGIDTRDFGLPVIRRYKLLKVNPVVMVRFRIEAQAPSPSRPPLEKAE